jgi:hypothetical protein
VQKSGIYSYHVQSPVVGQGQGASTANLAACMRAKAVERFVIFTAPPGWLILSYGMNHPWIALCIFLTPPDCAFVYEYGVLFIEFLLECSHDRRL